MPVAGFLRSRFRLLPPVPARRLAAAAVLIAGVALLAEPALLAAQETRVVMLGTGTPNPDPERSGPAVAIVTGGKAYLVDAGPGLVRRAAQAARDEKIAELQAARLGIVFITHLHSDHTVGLPDLLHTSWVAEREEPLQVFGPPGIEAMMEHLTAAWSEDIAVRTDGSQPHTPNGWKVAATTVQPGVIYRDANVVVEAVPVPHTTWKHAYGYRFTTRDRVIVVSGDTRGTDAIAQACNGCDVLIHEVYSAAGFARRPAPWQDYHRDSHISTTALAALATKARPGLLLLYHQLYWGATDADLIREIRAAGYTGPVESARDLGIY
ncbi:MAG: MBL fold metallo-hydrolase [Gemmatimonadales bacterium]